MPRALGLIRVSKDREGMTSPEVQEHAIREYARAHKFNIVDWVEGIDESGSDARSAWWPKLDASLDRVESGEVDALILWKFSRTGRNRLRWAITIDRADRLGGAIHSATESIDTNSSHGRLARGMVAEFNAYQADLIGDTWREAHARRFREGKPINGKPRFGYSYDREQKTFHPDPVNGPILAEVYRRYIAGESVYSLVKWLNAGPAEPSQGYAAKPSTEWNARTVRRILDSGFAAGIIRHGGRERIGIHEPLITESEWTAYQAVRDSRRTAHRTERSDYAFSGLVWCGCGAKMHGQRMGTPLTKRYRCSAAIAARRHSGGNVNESVVDAAIIKALKAHSNELRRQTAAALTNRPQTDTTKKRAALVSRLAEVSARQEKLAESMLDNRIPLKTYERLRDRYAEEERSLSAELRAIQVRATSPVVISPEILDRWGDLEAHEKRELAKTVVKKITVTPGRPQATVDVVFWE